MVYSCTNFTATGHCGHRSCIRWAIAVKMNFCKVLRCAFENNVVSSENTRLTKLLVPLQQQQPTIEFRDRQHCVAWPPCRRLWPVAAGVAAAGSGGGPRDPWQ